MDKIATREAYGNALAEYGNNTNIVVLDADLSKSTKTEIFKKKYPERFFNMGISEANMMGVAAGMASTGKIVFASTFAMFAAGRAFEQIRNSICYPKLNVKICATHAGISVGEDGATHQCIEDISLMRSIPNMTVVSPSDAIETNYAIKAAIDYIGPMYIRLGRLAVPMINNQDSYRFALGKGIELAGGNDIAIIATGLMVNEVLEARNMLLEKGISARIINIHTIKPIDKEIIIKAAKETKLIISVEEHNIIGGLGSAVCEVLAENYPCKVKMLGINDTFGRSGKPNELLDYYGLNSKKITENILKILKDAGF